MVRTSAVMTSMRAPVMTLARVASLGGLSVGLSIALGLSGCGGDDPVTPPVTSACDGAVDAYAPGLTKASEGGHFSVRLVSSLLAPPDRGDNGFVLRVMDAAGAEVADADVVVRPWMPNHGHGSTPATFTATAAASAGDVEVGPINFFMPGLWELRVTVTSAALQASERATFAFCVEG